MENSAITLVSTAVMVVSAIVTLGLQFRKNEHDAAEQVTNAALGMMQPLRDDNAILQRQNRLLDRYVAYQESGIRMLTRYIMELGKQPPWLPVDFDRFVENILKAEGLEPEK